MAWWKLFLTGGALYILLELFWRGRTHISMFIAGGASLSLLGGLTARFPSLPLPALCLVGAVVVTAIEFITGAVVNGKLGLNVWDYSDLPYNAYGQICLRYSLLWFLLCVPAAAVLHVVNEL